MQPRRDEGATRLVLRAISKTNERASDIAGPFCTDVELGVTNRKLYEGQCVSRDDNINERALSERAALQRCASSGATVIPSEIEGSKIIIESNN